MEVKVKRDLNDYVYPLRTVIADSDFSDLNILHKILKDKKIVGLGESTHGTREFFQLKHRLVKFLVEEMGYSIFTIEAGMIPCTGINDYVLKGKGDPNQALANQGYWIWDTEEVSELISWMRKYNLSAEKGRECQFIGYDIKPIEEACDILRRVMKVVDEEIYKKVDEIISPFENIVLPYDKKKAKEIDIREVLWILGWLKSHKIEICDAFNRATYNLAITSCKMIYQYLDGSIINFGDLKRRDLHMAQNLRLIIESLPPETKIIVWAHNGHIAVDDDWENLGYWLRRWYGNQYYAFGLTYTEGSFQARYIDEDEPNVHGPIKEFDLGMPTKEFWEYDLMQLAQGDFFLDFEEVKNHSNQLRHWITGQSQRLKVMGGGFNPKDPYPDNGIANKNYILGEIFDGVFHIAKTEGTISNPTGLR